MSRDYWMVRFRPQGGLEEHKFCETKEEAERIVRDLKGRGYTAVYWQM